MKTRDIAELALYEASRSRNPMVVQPRIEIHQQPHDAADAARLLSELKAKAQAEVLKAVSVQSNGFEAVVHTMLDHMSAKTNWRAVFKLNSKQMTATVETDPHRELVEAMQAAFAALRDEMARVIATEVLNDAFVTAMRERWVR